MEIIIVAAAESNFRRQSQKMAPLSVSLLSLMLSLHVLTTKITILASMKDLLLITKTLTLMQSHFFETMVLQQTLRDKGPINCIPTPVENVDM